MRERNLLHRGESVRPGGKPLDADLIGDIRKVAADLDWESPKPAGIVGRGVSVGLLAAGAHPVSTAFARMEADGGVTFYVSSTEVGQGARTVFSQIVAEELALPLEQVRVLGGDTQRHPLRPLHRRQPLDHARRSGRAARRRRDPRAAPRYRGRESSICRKRRLTVRAAAVWHEGESLPYPDLIKAHFGMVGGELIGHGEVRPERGSGSYAEGPVFWEVCIGGIEVEVDPEPAASPCNKAVSVADVGKALNPRLVEAQEMGGAMQGIGNAIHEEMLFDETGTLLNATLFEYHVPTIADMPDTFVSTIVENADGPGPYGAKGVGEGALAGVAAAIATALADAGVRDRHATRHARARVARAGGDGRSGLVNEGEAKAMKVYLLDNGTLMLDQSFATWNHGQGIEFRFPVYAFFVDHPDGKVMIDTGFDKAWVERKLPFEKPEQSEDQTIEAQLAKIGVKPEEIDIVINSHLHFDHCSNNKLFPQATFYFSKSELRHAYVPDPWERLGYDPDLVVMPGMKTELLDLGHYEYEVLPGITLIETPGHSAGHLSVILRPGGDTPPMVFPIDVAYTRHNLEDKVLMGLHSDPLELLDSMNRIENIAKKIGGKIFYSHDPEEYAGYTLCPAYYGG